MALGNKLQLYFSWLIIVFRFNNKLSNDYGILHHLLESYNFLINNGCVMYYFHVLRLHVGLFTGLNLNINIKGHLA